MINTAQDFETSIARVSEAAAVYNPQLNNEMNSAEFNNIFTTLESQINNLYEKVRLLEDIKNYTKDFVIRAIDERRQQLIENLKIIEAGVDDFSNKDYISVGVPFETEVGEILDRDGTIIPNLVLEDGNLVLASNDTTIKEVLDIKSNGPVQLLEVAPEVISDTLTFDTLITERTAWMPYHTAELFNEGTLDILDSKPYRSVYDAEEPTVNGLIVEYKISFDTLSGGCNYFDLSPINCEIENIELTAGNIVVTLDGSTPYLEEDLDITSAIVRVKCKDYERDSMDIPRATTEDSFDKIITGADILE